LRAQSVYVPHPKPFSDTTFRSMTSAWLGQPVKWAAPIDGDHFQYSAYADGRDPVIFGNTPNLFSDLHGDRKKTAAVGFVLPYCRLFREFLHECRTYQVYSPRFEVSATLLDAMAAHMVALSPFSTRQAHIKTYRNSVETAAKFAATQDYDFVFIHAPVPHGPWIFDGAAQEFSVLKGDYFDNLLLADKYLGTIVASMKESGVWRNSVLIVTSDHGVNAPLPGFPEGGNVVPLLIRFPGQERELVLKNDFNLVHLKKFVQKSFAGDIVEPEDFLQWAQNQD